MTANTTPEGTSEQPVEVTQADRDVADELLVHIGGLLPRGNMSDVEADIAKMFARHRIAVSPPQSNLHETQIAPEECPTPATDMACVERLVEDLGLCVGCNQPLRVGEVVTPWDDEVGHYDCNKPQSLERVPLLDADPDTPPPFVLLGKPARYVPLDAVRAAMDADVPSPAASREDGDDA